MTTPPRDERSATPHVDISVSGYDFRAGGPRSFYDFVRSVDVHHAELWPWNRVDSVDALIKLLQEYEVAIVCVNTSAERRLLVHPEAEVSKIIDDAIDLARALGAPFVNFYPGHRAELDSVQNMALFRERVLPHLDYAAERNVALLVETHFDRAERGEDPRGHDFLRWPEQTAMLVDWIRHPAFGVTFDPCNLYIAGVEPWPLAYRVLKPYIRYVHVKNAVRYARSLYGDPDVLELLTDSLNGAFMPVGLEEGALNWTLLVRDLIDGGFSGCLTIESHVGESDVAEVTKSEVKFLRQAIAQAGGRQSSWPVS